MNSSNKQFDVFEMIIDDENHADDARIDAVQSDQYPDHNWEVDNQEGQLAVDVIETETDIIVVSTMAGADTGAIEVYVHSDDLLTIRGRRSTPINDMYAKEVVHQECFWGKFSRTVVLPAHVYGDQAHARYKNGILLLTIPKKVQKASVPIEIIEE